MKFSKSRDSYSMKTESLSVFVSRSLSVCLSVSVSLPVCLSVCLPLSPPSLSPSPLSPLPPSLSLSLPFSLWLSSSGRIYLVVQCVCGRWLIGFVDLYVFIYFLFSFNFNNRYILYVAILWCTQTHCALQHSPTLSKFHKRNTYNHDN